MKHCLNLGSGSEYKESTKEEKWVNVDNAQVKKDVDWDLNKFPYEPFKDNQFDSVYIKSVLEHVDNPMRVMEEVHRISKGGAIVSILSPHFASLGAHSDITHKKEGFSYYSFDYLTEDFSHNFYTKVRFRILSQKIVYPTLFKPLEIIANWFPKHMKFGFVRFSLCVQSISHFNASNKQFIGQPDKHAKSL